jgi:hypothetical protein
VGKNLSRCLVLVNELNIPFKSLMDIILTICQRKLNTEFRGGF